MKNMKAVVVTDERKIELLDRPMSEVGGPPV